MDNPLSKYNDIDNHYDNDNDKAVDTVIDFLFRK